MKTKLILGDCLEEMKHLADNSIDATITDPPAGIGFMGKDWDSFKNINSGRTRSENEITAISKGPDSYITGLLGFQNFIFTAFTEVIRVLKPGGHAFVWAIPRTSHHTAMGLERAGFEIRDCITHLFGSGFPKSHNIGKAINMKISIENKSQNEWNGWGTALKPASEFWWLCRKPISEKTVAENVLKWETGGLNVDSCRISLKGEQPPEGSAKRIFHSNQYTNDKIYGDNQVTPQEGRFPANVVLSCICDKLFDAKASGSPGHWSKSKVTGYGKRKRYYGVGKKDDMKCAAHTNPECPCYLLDDQASKKGAFAPVKAGQKGFGGIIYGKYEQSSDDGYRDGLGGASRFFYCAKASTAERDAGLNDIEPRRMKGRDLGQDERNVPYKKRTSLLRNIHPTVKPIALMEYLLKLITPLGGTVLDPFMGSGSTGVACKKLQLGFIGIEKDPEYYEIARRRIDNCKPELSIF